MQKGSLICKEFYINGDGRTNGTAVDTSLGNSLELGQSILCNALRIILSNSNWSLDETQLQKDVTGLSVTMKSVVMDSVTVKFLVHETYEIIYTYLLANTGTKVLLSYNYGTVTETGKGVHVFCGSKSGSHPNLMTSTITDVSPKTYPYDLCFLYLSPAVAEKYTWEEVRAGTSDKNFKICSPCESLTNNAKGLSYAMTANQKFIYKIFTDDSDTLGVGLTSPAWNSSGSSHSLTVLAGQLLDEDSLNTLDTFADHAYATYSFQLSYSLQAVGTASSVSSYVIGASKFPGSDSQSFAYMQFYNAAGTVLHSHSDQSSYEKCDSPMTFSIVSNDIARAKNMYKGADSPFYLSQIMVGLYPLTSKTSSGTTTLLSHRVVDSTGDLYKGLFKEEFLVSTGMPALTIDNSPDKYCAIKCPNTGYKFNSSYVHIGCSVYMNYGSSSDAYNGSDAPAITIVSPTAES